MSKKSTTWIIVIIVLIIGSYFVFKSDDPQADQIAQENQETENKISFSDFIKQGGNYKCEISQNINGIKTSGATYIKGDMIRGEYNTEENGSTITTNMIVRDGYTYSWTSIMPTMGFKVRTETETENNTNADLPSSYGFYPGQVGDYYCEIWIPDLSKFELPEGINFTELETK